MFRAAQLLAYSALMGLAAGCAPFQQSETRIESELRKANVTPSFEYLESPGGTIRYMTAGDGSRTRVLFIHGAPGSLDAFNDFFARPELLEAAELVSVDRPGYGYSGLGRALADTAAQARALRALLRPGTVIVGHSFGGTIAMRLAMDNPELVGGLVLVAPSLSPVHEKRFFFTGMMERPLFNWMLPRAWKVSNTEKNRQLANLEAMDALWQFVAAPVLIVHGTRDRIVPIEHSYYAVERLPRATTQLDAVPGGRHFMLWTEIDLVSSRILQLVRQISVGPVQ